MKTFFELREANIVKSADKKPENFTKSDGTMGTRMVPTTKRSKEEGYVSAAQRKAVHASKADNKKSKKEDATSDAIAAFKAKGGKIKKLAPGKAAGYHGKDDPGADVHGMISRGDTKDMGTRKKVKSMEAARAVENFQVQKYTDGKKDGPAKSFGGSLKKATAHASKMKNSGAGDHRVHKETNETEPPFDNAVLRSKKPAKDQYGNIIKNRAASLARKAAKAQADKVKK